MHEFPSIFLLYMIIDFYFRKESAPVVNSGASTPSSQQYHVAPKPLMMEGEEGQGLGTQSWL